MHAPRSATFRRVGRWLVMVSLNPLEPAWPRVAGEMAQRVRTHDWTATPLGPADAWSPALRSVVELVLASPAAAAVALLEDRLLIYNDVAARWWGDEHPNALGRPLAEAFADRYPAVADVCERVFAGEAATVAALPLAIGKDGWPGRLRRLPHAGARRRGQGNWRAHGRRGCRRSAARGIGAA